MAEETLRRNLMRAFDAGPEFPHPLLLSRAMAALELEDRVPRDRSRRARPAWIMPAVAALLAVVIVATLVLVGRGLRPAHTTPAGPRGVATSKPIRVDPPSDAGCPSQCQAMPVALTYVSPNVIWAVVHSRSGHSTIYRTNDGGQHWEAQASWDNPSSQLEPMTTSVLRPSEHMEVSADGREALFVTLWGELGASVLHTTDGGAHWASFGFPLAAQPTKPAFFLNTREGWVVTRGSVANSDDIYHTTDSGAHWNLSASVASRPGFDLVHGQIEFQSSTAAWFVPEYANDSSIARTVFFTADRGATWQQRTLGNLPITPIEYKPNRFATMTAAAIIGIRFFNQREGVIETQSVGIGGTFVYTTSDGGSTWSAPRLIPDPVISFVDVNHWIDLANGTNGELLTTSDAGKTWEPVPGSAGSFGLGRIDFVDTSDGLGWNGGCPPNAVITHDGGSHWAELNLPFAQTPSGVCP
jgi:photosystem II stability/assembly factor-like uncharacterized protein